MPKDWLTLSGRRWSPAGWRDRSGSRPWSGPSRRRSPACSGGSGPLVEGIGSFAQAFQPGTSGWARFGLLAMGVIAFVVAFFAIFSPAVTAVTLTGSSASG